MDTIDVDCGMEIFVGRVPVIFVVVNFIPGLYLKLLHTDSRVSRSSVGSVFCLFDMSPIFDRVMAFNFVGVYRNDAWLADHAFLYRFNVPAPQTHFISEWPPSEGLLFVVVDEAAGSLIRSWYVAARSG